MTRSEFIEQLGFLLDTSEERVVDVVDFFESLTELNTEEMFGDILHTYDTVCDKYGTDIVSQIFNNMYILNSEYDGACQDLKEGVSIEEIERKAEIGKYTKF